MSSLAPRPHLAILSRVTNDKTAFSIYSDNLTVSSMLSKVAQQSVDKQPHSANGDDEKTPLVNAARKGDITEFNQLIELGADLDARGSNECGSLAIHLAAGFNRMAVVSRILELRPDHLEAKDSKGNSPLNMASFEGALDAVKFLVDTKQGNIEHRGEFGMTPLLMAAQQGHVPVIEFLLVNGANIDAVDSTAARNNALHLAAYFGHVDVVSVLLAANPLLLNEYNDKGETALDRAKRGNKTEVIRLLKSKGGKSSLGKYPGGIVRWLFG